MKQTALKTINRFLQVDFEFVQPKTILIRQGNLSLSFYFTMFTALGKHKRRKTIFSQVNTAANVLAHLLNWSDKFTVNKFYGKVSPAVTRGRYENEQTPQGDPSLSNYGVFNSTVSAVHSPTEGGGLSAPNTFRPDREIETSQVTSDTTNTSFIVWKTRQTFSASVHLIDL